MNSGFHRWLQCSLIFLSFSLLSLPARSLARDDLPQYLKDRGGGTPTSLFGTYIKKGEILIFPFFSRSIDRNQEYSPVGLGYGLDETYRGRYRASEGVIFAGYGLADWFAIELEVSYISATFEKSSQDLSATPATINESGIGDMEGQLRLNLMTERERKPELFCFLEITPPSQKDKKIIGAPDWDLKPGVGIVKGFSWGTLTFRSTLEYTREDSSLNVGETAIEYLKLLSPTWRLYCGIEGGEGGGPDEWVLTTGVQWRITDLTTLRFNNALGISSKANDWAPEVGILFSFPEV